MKIISLRTSILIMLTCLTVAQLSAAQKVTETVVTSTDFVEQTEQEPESEATVKAGENPTDANSSLTSLTWFSVNTFLQVTKSDFSVVLDADIDKNKINIHVSSEKKGNVLVYGTSKKSEVIYPLCGDYEFVKAEADINIQCENTDFTALEDEKMLFIFVVDSLEDIDSIRRFTQIRTELPDGTLLKGLNLMGPTSHTNTNSQASIDNSVTSELGTVDLGVAFTRLNHI